MIIALPSQINSFINHYQYDDKGPRWGFYYLYKFDRSVGFFSHCSGGSTKFNSFVGRYNRSHIGGDNCLG